MSDAELPEESRGEIVPVDRLDAEPVRMGIARWRALCAARRYPARATVDADGSPALSRNALLIKVIADGDAYEYEYERVGDGLITAFSDNLVGRRLSGIIADAPKFGLGLRMLFEMVRASGDPLGYRGWVGRDMKNAEFVYHESAVLPCGPHDFDVDHLLIMSAVVMRHDTDR